MKRIEKIYYTILIIIVSISVIMPIAYEVYDYFPTGKQQPEQFEWLNREKTELEYNGKKYVKANVDDGLIYNVYGYYEDAQMPNCLYTLTVNLGFNESFSSFVPILKSGGEFKRIETQKYRTLKSEHDKKNNIGFYQCGDIIFEFVSNVDFSFNCFINEDLTLQKDTDSSIIEKISVYKNNYMSMGKIFDYESGNKDVDGSEHYTNPQKAERLMKFACGEFVSEKDLVEVRDKKSETNEFYSALSSKESFMNYYQKIWENYKDKKIYFKVDLKDYPFSLVCFPRMIEEEINKASTNPYEQDTRVNLKDLLITDISIVNNEKTDSGYDYIFKISVKNTSPSACQAASSLILGLWYDGEEHYIRNNNGPSIYINEKIQTEKEGAFFVNGYDEADTYLTYSVTEQEHLTIEGLNDNNLAPDFYLKDPNTGELVELDYLAQDE